MQEMKVSFLGQEDLLEKEMATHSNKHAWKIPWTEETGGLRSMGSQRVGHDRATKPPPPTCLGAGTPTTLNTHKGRLYTQVNSNE